MQPTMLKDPDKIKVEIHLSKEEGKLLDEIVALEERSRKKWCEMEIRRILRFYDETKKNKKNNINFK